MPNALPDRIGAPTDNPFTECLEWEEEWEEEWEQRFVPIPFVPGYVLCKSGKCSSVACFPDSISAAVAVAPDLPPSPPSVPFGKRRQIPTSSDSCAQSAQMFGLDRFTDGQGRRRMKSLRNRGKVVKYSC